MNPNIFRVQPEHKGLVKKGIAQLHHQRLGIVVPVLIGLAVVFLGLDYLIIQRDGPSPQLWSYVVQDAVFLVVHIGFLVWLSTQGRETPNGVVYLYLTFILTWAVFAGNIEFQRTGNHTTLFLSVLSVSALGLFSVRGISWLIVVTLTTYALVNSLFPGPAVTNFENYFGLIALPFLSFAISRTLYAAVVRNLIANHELAVANADLKEARLNLIRQDKLASLGVLSAGIAHEINNPLAFIKGNVAALERNLATPGSSTDAENRAILEETKEGFRRIGEVVQALGTFARDLPPGEFPLYDLNQGIRATLAMTRHETSDIIVDTDLADMPLVPARGSEIHQILLNLLMNAFQAVRTLPSTEVRLVMVRSRTEGGSAIVEVSNSGPAIPAELREKIFDPFFSTKAPGAGMGLGLSLSWQIAASRHGGDLELMEGEPVTFRLRLPLSR